eukprot:TRINITY_DN17552_c0_g1_i1.p1 TRINITY_DN17552_c0_g1~~TRINITY_DN17552_c0_g1_i1.p1  ORF type:complete len:211 (-),score=39.34 TRINITY_DN17552_c0_g1_i1:96-728(-)
MSMMKYIKQFASRTNANMRHFYYVRNVLNLKPSMQNIKNILSFEDLIKNPSLLLRIPSVRDLEATKVLEEISKETEELFTKLEDKVDDIFDQLIEEVEFELNNYRTTLKAMVVDQKEQRDKLKRMINDLINPEAFIALLKHDLDKGLREFEKMVEKLRQTNTTAIESIRLFQREKDFNFKSLKAGLHIVETEALTEMKSMIHSFFYTRID